MSKTDDTTMIMLPSGASYPAFLEPLTENEKKLLDAYDAVRHYEREASRLKAEEAKRRLEEADERYRAKVAERERVEGEGENVNDKMEIRNKARERRPDDGRYESDEDEGAVDDDDEEENAATVERRKKREIKISRLRKEVDEANLAKNRREAEKVEAQKREEEMRRQLLGDAASPAMEEVGGMKKRPRPSGDDDEDDEHDEERVRGAASVAPPKIIKKKRRTSFDEPTSGPSLIANMTSGSVTPIHDFSKKLDMGPTCTDGNVLYPPLDSDDRRPWSPPSAPRDFVDGCLELELPNLNPSDNDGSSTDVGNNTIAIKFHAPKDSTRFSLNITTPDGARDGRFEDVLFHFNPRQFQRGGNLIINDKTATRWGNDISVPLSTMPYMFGIESCTLVVQINNDGFDVFVEGVHCARLEHRRALPAAMSGRQRPSLVLQFPSSDDYGNPENWLVYRVWWGRKPSMVDPEKLEGVAGVNLHSAVHPRRLFVSGLTKLFTDPEVDLRRAELERAFRKYGGLTGAVAVSLKKNSTFAFVEFSTEGLADLAMLEMTKSGRYRVNKARRTRHEALQEEREAVKGEAKEAVDWD